MLVYGIYLTGGTTLDYDTTASYVLSVTCSDHRRSDTDSFTVNLIRNTVSMTHTLPMYYLFIMRIQIHICVEAFQYVYLMHIWMASNTSFYKNK